MSFYPSTENLPPLGALCLDYTEDIHRPPGDPLNGLSFKFPLLHEKVEQASLWNVVSAEAFSEEFLERFAEACLKLSRRGAVGIITSCGFLAQVQQRLASKVPIPIATSSLLQIPPLLAMRPQNEHLGVITFDSATLGDVHFKGVGIEDSMRSRLTVIGCPANGCLRGIIRDGAPYIHEELEAELIDCALKLLEKDQQITAFVLECTQMPPFSTAIGKATGLPVYDVVTLIDWFYSGLQPRTFPMDAHKSAGLKRRERSDKELRRQ
ncbi:LAMI_0B09098g1_1 [Lachancea mirantina]|uniref:LAMI_0B09098g1_1 n=1 Tax=Lachancea mirantina TaxID=1230905 RepID=A0A1G4IYD5_9SACH|nr:LAMI_0B09098g1_1 [Lachancea mirantina]